MSDIENQDLYDGASADAPLIDSLEARLNA